MSGPVRLIAVIALATTSLLSGPFSAYAADDPTVTLAIDLRSVGGPTMGNARASGAGTATSSDFVKQRAVWVRDNGQFEAAAEAHKQTSEAYKKVIRNMIIP